MKRSVIIFQAVLWFLMWFAFVEHNPFWTAVLKVVVVFLILAGISFALSRENHQNLAKQRVYENLPSSARTLRWVSTAAWMQAMWLGFVFNEMWVWTLFWTLNCLVVFYGLNQIAVREHKLRSKG